MPQKSQFEKLNKEMLTCVKCNLSKTRTNVVPGEGSANAEIMFIGEGPGKNEDKLGRPFVGQAGKFLNELLTSISLKREDVYIANTVKCRPPGNRDPLPKEKENCWPWLERQLAIIQPKIIIPLGRHSLNLFIPEARISEVHGRAFRKPFTPLKEVVFFPCYHPAAALYNGSMREILIKDFKKIPKILEKIKAEGN